MNFYHWFLRLRKSVFNSKNLIFFLFVLYYLIRKYSKNGFRKFIKYLLFLQERIGSKQNRYPFKISW